MSSFSADLREYATRTKRTMRTALTGIVLELATRMVIKSPVDTGQFRGQWQIGDGTPDTRTDSEFDKQPLGSPPSPTTFARWQDQLEGARPGSVIYITNSLPYARRLEYEGWSKQAPAGMVRITISEYHQIIRRVLENAK